MRKKEKPVVVVAFAFAIYGGNWRERERWGSPDPDQFSQNRLAKPPTALFITKRCNRSTVFFSPPPFLEAG
jgi:hypothetical protein